MIRSHTKNIDRGDNDSRLVASIKEVEALATTLDKKVANLESGFARFYPTVIREYFGGMIRHFRSVKERMKQGAICTYVVGDQCSYAGVFIPTAKILSTIASQVGFQVVEIRRWRGRRSTTGTRSIDENLLILKNTK